jgi:hypothetical protein
MTADATLLSVQPVIQWRGVRNTETASSNFAGQSRPTGVAINYVLKSAPSGDVKIRIYDGSRLISEMDGTKTPGVNTVRWNLSGTREVGLAEGAAGRGGGRGGRGGGAPAGGGQTSYTVDPGEYRIVLSVGGKEYTQKAFVLQDPGR